MTKFDETMKNGIINALNAYVAENGNIDIEDYFLACGQWPNRVHINIISYGDEESAYPIEVTADGVKCTEHSREIVESQDTFVVPLDEIDYDDLKNIVEFIGNYTNVA